MTMVHKDQKKVTRLVRQALGLLKTARSIEFDIEEERIHSRDGEPYNQAFNEHDPLGREIESVIESLEEIVSNWEN